ncbi:MAG: YhjD/YihY/BrkB family envelope integrity protein, partial [Limisphaerales bacterium]
LMLVFIAIMMLSRIEDTFNDIWGVNRGRGWFARVTQYWAALTLGPVLLVMVVGLTSSTEFAGFHERLAQMPLGIGAVTAFLFKFLPFALLSLGFASFYALLPATKVDWKAALVGGIVGGSLWQLNNLLSVLYVSRIVSNNKVYGSLGMVPVVMIGLYFSWLILLFGAQVAYSFQNRRAYFQERQVESLDQRSREFIALRLMVEVARRFQSGEKPPSGSVLAELFGVPTRLTGKILTSLTSARLLTESNQGEPAYVPARPLEQMTCHDVLQALRVAPNGGLAMRPDATREPVRLHYERIQALEQAAAKNVTLAALAAEAAAVGHSQGESPAVSGR